MEPFTAKDAHYVAWLYLRADLCASQRPQASLSEFQSIVHIAMAREYIHVPCMARPGQGVPRREFRLR